MIPFYREAAKLAKLAKKDFFSKQMIRGPFQAFGSFSFLRGFAVTILFFVSIPADAQESYYSTLFIPYPLEDFNGAPRPGAMGSAFTAAEGDLACLYFNPAGLETLRTTQVTFLHQSALDGISRETLLAAFPTPKFGTFAFSAHYVNFGTLQGFDPSGSPTAPYNPFRVGLSLGWAIRLAPWISVGLSTREFLDSLATGQASLAYSLCAGALVRILPDLRAGVFYSCLYTDSEAQLGLLKLGAAWSPVLDRSDPTLVQVDLSMPPQGIFRVQCGLEQTLFTIFYARFGHQWELKDNRILGFRGLTAGLGVKIEDFSLDCSFSPDGDLGDFKSVGLSYRFPQKTQPPVTFKPSADPAAKVVDVEVEFNIPDKPGNASAATDPKVQSDLAILGARVQADPQDPQAWTQMGLLYWKTGQKNFALQCFGEVLRLQPQNLKLKDWLEKREKGPSSPGE